MNAPALAVVAVVGCTSSSSPPTTQPIAPADVARIRELVHGAQTTADAYATARTDGLRAAWRAPDLATSDAPCPVALPTLPPYRDYAQQTPEDRAAFDIERFRMTVVSGAAVLGDPPPADEKMMQRIERENATRGPRRDQFERQSSMLLRIADDAKVHQGLDDDLKNEAYRGAIKALHAVAAR